MNCNSRRITNPFRFTFLMASGAFFLLSTLAVAAENPVGTSIMQNKHQQILPSTTMKKIPAERQFLANNREEYEDEYEGETCCRDGERHHGMGRQGRGGHHMGRGKGHHGGRGMGGMGHGMHHGGRHGMHHGSGDETAECPQPRSTAQAPEPILNQANPLETSPDNIENGRLLFQLDAQPTCTTCHGPSGDGLGMMGGALTPPPRNFTCAQTMQSIPDGQLFWIIKNGSPGTGMPAFSNLSDEEVWKLVLHIRSLARAK